MAILYFLTAYFGSMDARKGNIILFDSYESRKPAKPYLRGMVVGCEKGYILFQGDFRRMVEECAGVVLTENWLISFGFTCASRGCYKLNGIIWDAFERSVKYKNESATCEFVHELQNFYQDKTGNLLEVVIIRP